MTIQRAIQLIEMNRYTDAERLLRTTLADSPDDASAHGFLSSCLIHQKKIKEAHDEADLAIGLNPNISWFYSTKARAFMADDRYVQAEEWFLKAIELEPDNATYHSNIANCRLLRDDLQGAFEFSARSMELDPDDEDVVDIHVLILNKMGRKEEANELLEGSLHRNPENDFAHANQGWAELHNNNPKKARIHFEEALKISPSNEYARSGLLESIKAGNPIYRIMLLWMLWLGKLSPNTRWIVLLGGYAVFRLADRASYAWPEYTLFIKPIVYAYFIFAIMTWFTKPLFDLLLFFHPVGRHALTRLEWKSCLIASIFLLLATIGCILYLFGLHAITLLSAYFFAMMVPHVYSTVSEENKRHKLIFTIYCSVLLIAGIIFLILIYQENILGAKIMNYTIYAWIGFAFLDTYLTSKPK